MRDAVILQIHSTGTSTGLWATYTADPLPAAGRLRPALLGYPPGPALTRGAVVRAADDARHLLAELPVDGAVHVVAHSYGASVGLELVPLLGDRLASLFLYEPVLFGALARDEGSEPAAVAEARAFAEHPWFLVDDARGGGDEWLAHFIDYWNRPGSWQRMPAAAQAATRALGWKMYQEVRSCFFDVQAFGERPLARVPSTIVTGERSTAGARAMARAVVRESPWARLVELPGLGHMGPLTHPGPVHAAMNEHLARALA